MNLKKLMALTAVAALGLGMQTALADTISFEGVVAPRTQCEVCADVGGIVDSLDVSAGETLLAGAPLITLRTNKFYAEQDGTVTGIFAEPGDSAQSVAARYGAVMYIEPASAYTVSASTDKAYNSIDTKYVHIGETVYLSCYSDGDHEGVGRVTSVTGTDFSVEVTSGEFLIGEEVNLYRSESHRSRNRIGRGKVARSNPAAISAQGAIVSLNVKDGAQVKRGELLFETLDGSFDGLYMHGCSINAPVNGYIADIHAAVGSAIAENSAVATIYPADAMRIEADISENDLGSVSIGDKVSIELNWNQDDEIGYQGVVTMISSIANPASAESDEATYKVYMDFTPDENTRYGMNAVISTLDAEDEPLDADEA